MSGCCLVAAIRRELARDLYTCANDSCTHALPISQLSGPLRCELARCKTWMDSQSSGHREPKRPRVGDFGRQSHVTASALAKLLGQVRDEGLPASFSASTVARERRTTANQDTKYGPLIVELDTVDKKGRAFKVPFASPMAMLSVAAEQSTSFADMLRSLLGMRACSHEHPYSIVLYSDEITPGDPLKAGDRKIQAVYWSIKEFGSHALANEDLWFTLTTLRSCRVKQLEDGMSHLYNMALHAFFDLGGHSVRNGVSLRLKGADVQVLLFLDLGVCLGDERALKELTGAKGAAGKKPCCLCRNVIAYRQYSPEDQGINVPFHLFGQVIDQVAQRCVCKGGADSHRGAGARHVGGAAY